MGKGLFDILLDQIFDADWVGKRGEKLTERELKLVQLFGRSGKTLRNVYIPKGNGETSEIDVMFITQKGIFVFESKNYSGWIFGDENATYWTVMLPSREKSKLYNPIKQNRTHIKWLNNYLSDEVPLFSIVVFSERCELKKVAVTSTDVHVIKRDRTYATVRSIWDASPDVLSETQIEEIYEKLQQLTNVDASVKAAHVAEINRKYKQASSPATPKPTQKAQFDTVLKNCTQIADPTLSQTPPVLTTLSDEVATPSTQLALPTEPTEPVHICPRCGSPLVLRTARKGTNAGNQFYGCSNYPHCKYTENL